LSPRGRRTGSDPVPATTRHYLDNRALPRLQAEVARRSQR
jgi:hypothetical protein